MVWGGNENPYLYYLAPLLTNDFPFYDYLRLLRRKKHHILLRKIWCFFLLSSRK